MPKNKTNSKAVEIACPHQRKIIKGLYPCGSDGRYLLAADGVFGLELVECSQDEGRCVETLCALHRFNRRGPGTWYPNELRAIPERKPRRQRPTRPGGQDKNCDGKNLFDQLC